MVKLNNKQLDYETFVDKFKQKNTTDDCMTPPEVFEVIRDWACEEYGIAPSSIVRPFWPGGDYLKFDYPDGCVVLDNPPFSQLAAICRFYLRKSIPFFLFAPSLTCLSGKTIMTKVNHIITNCTITYENGAEVATSFITSFGWPEVFRTSPELTRRVNRITEEIRKNQRKQIPKYSYPDHILTAAMGQKYARYGVEFVVRADECEPISALDAQKDVGKAIYGGGLLLCDEKAAERAIAERVAADRAEQERTASERWELTERERRRISMIGKRNEVVQEELFDD